MDFRRGLEEEISVKRLMQWHSKLHRSQHRWGGKDIIESYWRRRAWWIIGDKKMGRWSFWVSLLDDSGATFRNGKYWRDNKFGEKINHWPNEDLLGLKQKQSSDFSDLGNEWWFGWKTRRNQDGSCRDKWSRERYLVGGGMGKATLSW